MGTRGTYGFIHNNKEKVTYNHFDSYPDGLGSSIIDFIKQTDNKEMLKIADCIKLVNEDDKPTPEQIIQYTKHADLDVSTQSIEDWYCLLRNTQGVLAVYKNGVEHMIDGQIFLQDSLFCEWAYIINTDTMQLEVYKGFNKNHNARGRYANTTADSQGYCGVKLIDTIMLNDIRKADKPTIEKLFKEWDN